MGGIEHRSRIIAVEVKFSAAPKPTKGFWEALKDLRVNKAYVIAPVQRRYALADGVEVVPVSTLGELCG